jgi:F-box protein 21
MTIRQKALELNAWLRSKNLTGLRNPEKNYRNMRNNYLGQALRDPEHQSLPIISSAIYCCVGTRLGISAMPCALPGHVYVVVTAEAGWSLDQLLTTSPPNQARDAKERMYLDPFNLDDEVPVESLRSRLIMAGLQLTANWLLSPAPAQTIAVRAAQNMRYSTAMGRELLHDQNYQVYDEFSRLMTGSLPKDLAASAYSACWAQVLLNGSIGFGTDMNLTQLLHGFGADFVEDAWLVEKYLCPFAEQFYSARQDNEIRDDPRRFVYSVRQFDAAQPTVVRRRPNSVAKFKVGQVICHKRYRYIGIISGWAEHPRSSPDESSVETGIGDCFYTCM